jgi:hypothetical protein
MLQWHPREPLWPVDSGFGRERGLPGIRDYLQIKNVGIRL